jgi:hypothetical protein
VAREPDASQSDAWTHIKELMIGRDPSRLALGVDDLDDQQRPMVASALRAFAASDDPEFLPYERTALLAIVGAGVLPDAKTTGAWLSRYRPSRTVIDRDSGSYTHGDVVPQLIFVLTRRSVDWLPELAGELARRLPRDPGYHEPGERFRLVDGLLEVTGQAPPTDTGFVVGWVVQQRTVDEVVAALEDEPRLADLIPRLFEIEEVGAQIDRFHHWPPALADLAGRGLVSRAVLLDACTARLGRRGKPGAGRGYLAVLKRLHPTDEEAVKRADSYVSMVSVGTAAIAGYAQQVLLHLDSVRLLPPAVLLTASQSTLRRTEKKLVRSQLTHLGRTGMDQARDTAQVILEALPHLAPDLARTAISTVRRLAAQLTPDERRRLLDEVPTLPRDFSAMLDIEYRAGEQPGLVDSAATWRPVRINPLIGRVDVMAETTALFGRRADPEPAHIERVLEALIHWHRADRSSLAENMSVIVSGERLDQPIFENTYQHFTFRGLLGSVIRAAAGQPSHPRYRLEVESDPTTSDLVVHRLSAIAAALSQATPGYPLSRPSWDNGTIAIDDLLTRLRQSAVAGTEPWPIELELALLRLIKPAEDVRESTADAFRAIGTPAARAAATWVAKGLPVDPPLDAGEPLIRQTSYLQDGSWSVVHDLVLTPRPAAPATDSMLWNALINFTPQPFYGQSDFHHHKRSVPWLAPGHRELIATRFLPELAASREGSNEIAPALPVLAELDGPFGPAMALALTYGLAASRSPARDHAARAIVVLGSRNLLDPELLGETVADLFERQIILLSRIVAPLRDAAAAGASQAVWETLRAALPTLLRSQPAPTGMAGVLGLAAETAERVGAHGRIAGLDEFAGRPGSSRQLVEARRLRKLLAD